MSGKRQLLRFCPMTQSGFSLIELVVVIVVIGILLSIAMQSMEGLVKDARLSKTEREMEMLAKAIVGNPDIAGGGGRSDFGYVGDIGAFPSNLQALYENPGYGTWNGPYIPFGLTQDSTGFKIDEWGKAYTYSGGITITSTGSGTTISKKIADATSDYLLNTCNGTIKDANDSLPGATYADSINIKITIPDGSGSIIVKTYHPDSTGAFTLDSLPVNTHPLEIIYIPENDTLHRFLTIFPRHRSNKHYRFAFDYFGNDADSEMIVLSTQNLASIGGLSFGDEDIVVYDPAADTASLFFDGSAIFAGSEIIDAVHVLPDNHSVISTSSSASIGGLTFDEDDLIEYNPSTGTATIYLDGATVFSLGENIDAVHILSNGHIIMSTANSATIGPLSFNDYDLVEYNPVAGTATLYFDGGTVLSGASNIDAVYVRDNGNIILSTDAASESIGSLTFNDEDLVEYNPITGNAIMYFDSDIPFGTESEDINGVYIK
ncbi:MAG: prepilin-type N-terminal cleavage/methylation domain-containing protein [candidate division Zixibacteria bacterium]|nr:prepilin-type N-terminal cleavage/methylation domain-containing protein [candidate division Zixibacteria bacterium]